MRIAVANFKQVEDNILLSGDAFCPRGVSPGWVLPPSSSGPGVFRARGGSWRRFRYTLANFVSRHAPGAACPSRSVDEHPPQTEPAPTPLPASAPLHPDQPERSRHTTHLTPPPTGPDSDPKNRGWGQIRPARWGQMGLSFSVGPCPCRVPTTGRVPGTSPRRGAGVEPRCSVPVTGWCPAGAARRAVGSRW